MDYQQFKAEWNGRRVDYDHVYAYQCVDLILEYLKEVCGIPSGVWGNAIDYANHPTATFTQHFTRVALPSVQGDIVVLNGLPGNPYGHIGLHDHGDASGEWMLEQNMTGDGTGLGRSAIGVYRSIPTTRIAAVWRFKGAPAPAPAPAPARSNVFLPANSGLWHLYNIGSDYNPNHPASVRGILEPGLFGGLTYKLEGYVAGGNGGIVTSHDFGRGVVWLKGTPAVVK